MLLTTSTSTTSCSGWCCEMSGCGQNLSGWSWGCGFIESNMYSRTWSSLSLEIRFLNNEKKKTHM